MIRAIELHDSVITASDNDGDSVVLELSAYVYEFERGPGSEYGRGDWQAIRIRFGDVANPRQVPPGWLSEGRIRIDNATYESIFPLPFFGVGRISATFVFFDTAATVVISAKTVDSEVIIEKSF